MTYIEISLCVNDERGINIGLQAIEFGPWLKLESASGLLPVCKCACDGRQLAIDGVRWPVLDYRRYAGNVCWDAVRMSPVMADSFLAYIQREYRGQWCLTEAVPDVQRAWDNGEDVHLLEWGAK